MIDRLRLARIHTLCLIIAAALFPTVAAAQASPARLVQATDRTLYLIAGSSAWTVVPDQGTDGDLAVLTLLGSFSVTLPPAAVSTDLGVLTAFSGQVLLPDPTTEPFTQLTLWDVKAKPDNYTIGYQQGPGFWEFVGTTAHTDYDDWTTGGCPGEDYCASADTEVFRGSQALGPKSALLHGPATKDVAAIIGSGASAWGVTWLDDSGKIGYELDVFGPPANAYGTGLSPRNRAGAERLAALARQYIQSNPRQSRIISTSDGTLYLVVGKYTWTIEPDAISDDDLAALDTKGEFDGALPPYLPD